MARAEKLLEKARNNPSGLSFDDFETLLGRLGWAQRGQEGSHRLWYSPKGHRLPIQPARNGRAKRYQVKQFLDAIEEE
ncbi:MAG: type II toxin-antitoxin system HicA family toxin [Gammaproteobacteria bacterium]